MKKKTILLLIFTLIFSLAFFASCSKKDGTSESSNDNTTVTEEDIVIVDDVEDEDDFVDDEDTTVKDNGISYDQEVEGAEIKKMPSDSSSFIGSWTAPSDKAAYLYGNIDITIKEDGTWTGNITGETMSGKWKDGGDSILVQNDLINYQLVKDSSGKVVLVDPRRELNTVLVRK